MDVSQDGLKKPFVQAFQNSPNTHLPNSRLAALELWQLNLQICLERGNPARLGGREPSILWNWGSSTAWIWKACEGGLSGWLLPSHTAGMVQQQLQLLQLTAVTLKPVSCRVALMLLNGMWEPYSHHQPRAPTSSLGFGSQWLFKMHNIWFKRFYFVNMYSEFENRSTLTVLQKPCLSYFGAVLRYLSSISSTEMLINRSESFLLWYYIIQNCIDIKYQSGYEKCYEKVTVYAQ